MPSTYAHYRFGHDTLELLSPELQSRISENMELFDIGLHGPEVFLCYRPFSENRVNGLARSMRENPDPHFIDGAQTLVSAAATRSVQMKAGLEVYMLGFICYRVLEDACRDGIQGKASEGTFSCAQIEAEFDHVLLAQAAYHVTPHPFTDHIRPGMARARVVQRFYPELTVREVERSLVSMRRMNRLLHTSSALEQSLVRAAIKVMDDDDEMSGYIIERLPNLECAQTCAQLRMSYREARSDAALSICLFDTSLAYESVGFPVRCQRRIAQPVHAIPTSPETCVTQPSVLA